MDIAVVKSRDLNPAVREWVQKLFRKPLEEDDEVSLFVRPLSVPSADEREAARLGLADSLAKIHAATERVAEVELDAAVDEAQTAVRRTYVPKR